MTDTLSTKFANLPTETIDYTSLNISINLGSIPTVYVLDFI